ncbi:hypothetical protein ACFFTQ_37520 [Streptomyces roseofulvus]|uniref:hypothetical protein n=1 Tax=Streptomyces roseofulvus TaxID=33902 RepID=UPI0035E846C9
MILVTADGNATARTFIAYYLHDVAANAVEDGRPALIARRPPSTPRGRTVAR